MLERARVIASGRPIDAADLLFDVPTDVTLPPSVDDEHARIVHALESCAGNQTRAAELLGISRTTLVQKIRLYRIPRPHRPR